MPTLSTKIEAGSNRLYRVKEDGSHREAVSNFSLQILGLLNVAPDAGGSGLLLLVKIYPDDSEKYVLLDLVCPI